MSLFCFGLVQTINLLTNVVNSGKLQLAVQF